MLGTIRQGVELAVDAPPTRNVSLGDFDRFSMKEVASFALSLEPKTDTARTTSFGALQQRQSG